MLNIKKLEEILKDKSKTKIIMIVGILGIVLIFTSILLPTNTKSKDEKNISLTTKQYEKELEDKIGELVSRIEGVGNSKVTVTLENGVENVYANTQKKSTNKSNTNSNGQNTQKSDSEQEVVIIDGKNGKEALMVTQKEPTVKGVVVVCDGADNIKTEKMIKEAVTTSLNIKSNRVSVVKSNTTKNN